MKNNILKILLSLFLLTNMVYAFDTLRGAGSSSKVVQEEQSYSDKAKHWYKSLIGKSQDKPKTTQSDDVIIINSDRSITFNGKTIKLGSHINEWIKVIGNDYRLFHNQSYYWDDLGINLVLKRNNKTGKILKERIVKQLTIQLISFREMFPSYSDDNPNPMRKPRGGGTSEFYFKGLVQIEDGYLSRETSFEEFRKSDISRTFRNTFSRPSTYKRGFLDENKFSYKRIYIDLTNNRFVKRISISTSMTKEELKEIKRKAKKQLEK